MEIEWFRDLVISIWGLTAIVVFVFIAVLCYLTYRKINPILESLKATSKTIQGISTYASDKIAKPLIEMTAVIQGIIHGIDAFTKHSKKEGGEKDV